MNNTQALVRIEKDEIPKVGETIWVWDPDDDIETYAIPIKVTEHTRFTDPLVKLEPIYPKKTLEALATQYSEETFQKIVNSFPKEVTIHLNYLWRKN